MNEPLVSVIIPCYNAEKYVESAVRSIMNQTYKNLEILITDDCSTDKTLEILNRLAIEDSRIQIIKNDKNLKIVKSLNNMIKLAKGKYIARMDADDISMPERIEKQVDFLEANTEIAFCGTNAVYIDYKGRKIINSNLPCKHEDIVFYLKFYNCFSHPSIMISADILKDNLYSEDFPYCEDYELWCRLIFARNLKGENLIQSIVKYRVYSEQISSTRSRIQKESSAKIIRKYNMISNEHEKNHINVFFLHNATKGNASELSYIKHVFSHLKNFNFSFPIYQQILLHFRNNYPFSKSFTYFLCFSSLRTVIRTLNIKRRGRRL